MAVKLESDVEFIIDNFFSYKRSSMDIETAIKLESSIEFITNDHS